MIIIHSISWKYYSGYLFEINDPPHRREPFTFSMNTIHGYKFGGVGSPPTMYGFGFRVLLLSFPQVHFFLVVLVVEDVCWAAVDVVVADVDVVVAVDIDVDDCVVTYLGLAEENMNGENWIGLLLDESWFVFSGVNLKTRHPRVRFTRVRWKKMLRNISNPRLSTSDWGNMTEKM